MKIKYTFLALIFVSPMVFGQSMESQSLKWLVDKLDNTAHSDEVVLSSWLETNAQVVKWYQKGGAVVYQFEITGRTGNWSDVSQSGQSTLSVTFRQMPGTIVFKRTTEGISIETNIQKNGSNLMPYVFHVTQITTL
jgi:hypothetical protein